MSDGVWQAEIYRLIRAEPTSDVVAGFRADDAEMALDKAEEYLDGEHKGFDKMSGGDRDSCWGGRSPSRTEVFRTVAYFSRDFDEQGSSDKHFLYLIIVTEGP